jgi:HTH-type transcriptional regulator, competence development regulator
MAKESPQPAETFGATIQRLRRERGLTQRQVAAQLGIDFTYLSKLENDRGEPPSEKAVRNLAKALHVDAEELLARAGRLPTELRDRAQADVSFARLLRRLPDASDRELSEIYRRLKIESPEK